MKTIPVRTIFGNTTLFTIAKSKSYDTLNENNKPEYSVELKKGTNYSKFPKEFEGIKINYYEETKGHFL